MSELGRLLVFAGIALVVAGGLLLLMGRMPGLPFGKLPGDFSWERGNMTVYFPLATLIIVSIVLTILANLVVRLFR